MLWRHALSTSNKSKPMRLAVSGTWLAGFLVPAHLKHRVEWTDPGAKTVWVGVFY